MPNDMLTLLDQLSKPGLTLEQFGLSSAAAFIASLIVSGMWVPR
jgi:hypothetical protein